MLVVTVASCDRGQFGTAPRDEIGSVLRVAAPVHLFVAAHNSVGATRRLSDHPGQDAHPWFSPDGKWIVFTSERAGLTDEEPMVQEVVFGPQMYGEIYAQRLADGAVVGSCTTNVRRGTRSG